MVPRMALPNDDKQRVADAVTAMLRDRDITHEVAADRTGIPYRTLRRRLAGIGKAFDIDELAALGAMLDVSITALITYAEATELVAS